MKGRAARRDQIANWKRQHSARLVQVVLAIFETDDHQFELAWVRREGPQFRVADRATETFCWFATYEEAHGVYVAACEEEGRPTFRSHAAQGGAS